MGGEVCQSRFYFGVDIVSLELALELSDSHLRSIQKKILDKQSGWTDGADVVELNLLL